MKRLGSMIVVVLLLVAVMLSGCEMESQREPDVLLMMDAVAESDRAAAAALVHPSQDLDEFLAEFPAICRFVAGRYVNNVRQTQCEVTANYSDSTVQIRESGTFSGSLDDGGRFNLSYVYVEDELGAGFTVFHLMFQKQ